VSRGAEWEAVPRAATPATRGLLRRSGKRCRMRELRLARRKGKNAARMGKVGQSIG
jgi:hypothetical protein